MGCEILSSKKDKIIVFGLIGVFAIVVFVFLGVAYYADVYYPKEFKEKFCRQDYVDKEFSAYDVLKEWSLSRVNQHQVFIQKLSPIGEKRALDTSMGQNVIHSLESSGGHFRIGAELGLLQLDTCEVTFENGHIQKVYFALDAEVEEEP